MGTKRSLAFLALCVWTSLGSGCAFQDMKLANRRLKDSNDRLIAENNRLESELAAAQRDAVQRATYVPPVAAAPTPAPSREPARTAVANALLLEDGNNGITVDRTPLGVRIRVPDRVFFGPGQVRLSSNGKRVLQRVARLIRSEYDGRLVRVDGHTDDTPTRKVKARFPTNWELSTARACAVVRYLVEDGNVNANSIFPAGFSYYRPVQAGRTTSARSKNRRVEITILNDLEA